MCVEAQRNRTEKRGPLRKVFAVAAGSTAVADGGDVRLGLPEAVGPMGDHHHLVVHRRSSHPWRSERIGVDRIVVRITEL